MVLCGEDLSVGTGLKTPRGKLSCEVNPLCEVGRVYGFRLGVEDTRIKQLSSEELGGISLIGSSWSYDCLGVFWEGVHCTGLGGDDSVLSHGSRR